MTAQQLLAMHKVWVLADQERMKRRPAGMPRMAWRGDNPIPPVNYPSPRDTAFKSRPRRYIGCIDHSTRLFVSSGQRYIEVIDLAAPDADTRLARYDFT